MGTFVFNIAKGRVAELYNRVDSNDPANSALIVVPVDRAAVADSALVDLDTLSAVLGAGLTERSTNNWNRKTLTDTDLTAMTPDDTNDRMPLDLADITWSPGPTAGTVTDLLICYDSDTTAGTDANIVPLTCHTFAITPDGSDVTATVTDFYRAS